jgi:hypothetical protein
MICRDARGILGSGGSSPILLTGARFCPGCPQSRVCPERSGGTRPSGALLTASFFQFEELREDEPHAAAVAFSIVVGLFQAYLGAHWLSDATAGILLGTSCALVTALAADQFQRRQNKLQWPAAAQCLAGVPPAHRAEDRPGASHQLGDAHPSADRLARPGGVFPGFRGSSQHLFG